MIAITRRMFTTMRQMKALSWADWVSNSLLLHFEQIITGAFSAILRKIRARHAGMMMKKDIFDRQRKASDIEDRRTFGMLILWSNLQNAHTDIRNVDVATRSDVANLECARIEGQKLYRMRDTNPPAVPKMLLEMKNTVRPVRTLMHRIAVLAEKRNFPVSLKSPKRSFF